MKADDIAKSIEKTGELTYDVLKNTADNLRHCWVVNQLDCANYLTDEEFEQLQGLVKKVELKKEMKKDGKQMDKDK